MGRQPTAFRILLAEDDPVSRVFLADAASTCGAEVLAVSDGEAALAEARATAFDLLILDHRLPGLRGDEVLRSLRSDTAACSRTAPAIATSAASDPPAAQLRAAGFSEVLPKPMGLSALRDALRRHGCARLATLLDDDAARRACGSADAMASLRRLFARELAQLQDDLEGLRGDPRTFDERLHRLRASCGFCGATALAEAAERLRESFESKDGTRTDAAFVAFRDALRDTHAALETSE